MFLPALEGPSAGSPLSVFQRYRRRVHTEFIGAAEIVSTLLRTPRTRHYRALRCFRTPQARRRRTRPTAVARTALRLDHRPAQDRLVPAHDCYSGRSGSEPSQSTQVGASEPAEVPPVGFFREIMRPRPRGGSRANLGLRLWNRSAPTPARHALGTRYATPGLGRSSPHPSQDDRRTRFSVFRPARPQVGCPPGSPRSHAWPMPMRETPMKTAHPRARWIIASSAAA